MAKGQCPIWEGSNFYQSGSKMDPEVIPIDDIVFAAFGNRVRYTVCKDCKNIQIWLMRNE